MTILSRPDYYLSETGLNYTIVTKITRFSNSINKESVTVDRNKVKNKL